MDGFLPPTAAAHQDPTVKDLAALCVGGDRYAGLELVEQLARMGVVATIDMMVLLAVPTAKITAAAFDALADALYAAHELQAEP